MSTLGSQQFQAVRSTITYFPEANKDDTNSNRNTVGEGLYLVPSKNVPSRPNDITGYVIRAANEDGKMVWEALDETLSLDDLSDVSINSPQAGEVLKYDGNEWINAVESATAGGDNTQVQYNNLGSLDGDSNFTWNSNLSQLNVNGNITSSAFSDGTILIVGGKITNLLTPILSSDAANKAYVDSIALGLKWKEPVLVSTNIPININTPINTIDGVIMNAGDRVLIKSGSTTSPGSSSIDNGIYIYGNPMTRSFDMPIGIDASGIACFVERGIICGGCGLVCNTPPPNDIVGTDPLEFVQFNGAENIIAGLGLSKIANTINVNVDNVDIGVSGTNQIELINTTVVPGDYKKTDITVDSKGRITSASSSNAYSIFTGVFLNPSSSTTRFMNWGQVPNNQTTLANTQYLPLSGIIKYATFTWVSTVDINIPVGASYSFSIGDIPGNNPNGTFTPFVGGSNVVTWDNIVSGTWPSTSSILLNIPFTAGTQFACLGSEIGTVTPTGGEINALFVIEFD